jgi:hypothetical protein
MMGWSSGSELFGEVVRILEDKISDNEKKDIYIDLIIAFENMDAELFGDFYSRGDKYLDEAFEELYPDAIAEFKELE